MISQEIGSVQNRIEELLDRYNKLVQANDSLTKELTNAKMQINSQNLEIIRLQEEIKKRNMLDEDLMNKIEAALGK